VQLVASEPPAEAPKRRRRLRRLDEDEHSRPVSEGAADKERCMQQAKAAGLSAAGREFKWRGEATQSSRLLGLETAIAKRTELHRSLQLGPVPLEAGLEGKSSAALPAALSAVSGSAAGGRDASFPRPVASKSEEKVEADTEKEQESDMDMEIEEDEISSNGSQTKAKDEKVEADTEKEQESDMDMEIEEDEISSNGSQTKAKDAEEAEKEEREEEVHAEEKNEEEDSDNEVEMEDA